MSRPCTPIELSDQDRAVLESWIRSTKTEQRTAFRARILLAAAEGEANTEIAARLSTRPATVSKWRLRFATHRIAGLGDAPRPGKKRHYGAGTEKRILAKLDQSPPEGYATWSGGLIAEDLGDVSKHQVWRVLRKHGIHPQRRRSWCISTDPEFVPKARTSSGFISIPLKTPLCFPWTRSRTYRPWNAPRAG